MQEYLSDKFRLRLIAILVCLPILQALLFPDMSGLNSDKAQWGIEAVDIIQGRRLPLAGVTPYGGTIRICLIACSLFIFGVNRTALELPFAVFSSMTIVFLYLLVRRLFSSSAGFSCVLVLSACPWFVIRNIDNWYYFSASLALLLLFLNRPWAFMSAGIVFGAACYEHQLAVIIGLSAFLSWLVCGEKDRSAIRNVLLVGVGWAIGFSPRLIYAFSSGTPVYVEPFNNLLRAIGDARMFAPYFLGMVNGPVIYLRNVGCVTYKVVPLNGILFIGASILLLAFRRRRLYRALLLFTLLLYLLPFAVIKYTAIRYFLCALFGVALITGLGLYELSLRYRKTAVALLAVYCGVNIFYLCANFIVPFARTGGNCVLFKMGNLEEASHHLVRSDVLYECLDKDVPVIVCYEPFISRNLQFYDVTNDHFNTITNRVEFGYDDFYFIDYAPSKLGIEIDPGRFPAYQIKRECEGLKNFAVYRFRKRWTRAMERWE